MKNNRVVWIDALKGLAIIFVVLGHVLLGYTENNAFLNFNDQMNVVMNWIYIWHMPLFFMLSGLTFSISCFEKNGLVNDFKVKKNCINLICLYIIFDISIIILKCVFSDFVDNQINKVEALLNIFFPNTLMWYLWVLIIYYIIFSKINIEKNIRKIEVVLVIAAIIMKWADLQFGIRLCIKNGIYCAPFFVLGIIVKKWLFDKKVKLKCKIKRTVTMILFGEVAIFSTVYTSMGYSNILIEIKIVCEFLTAVNSCLLGIIIFRTVSFLGESKILSNFGRASLVIYLIHTYIVTALKRFTILINLTSPITTIIIVMIITLSITYGIYWLSQRNKILYYLFRPIAFVESRWNYICKLKK